MDQGHGKGGFWETVRFTFAGEGGDLLPRGTYTKLVMRLVFRHGGVTNVYRRKSRTDDLLTTHFFRV